MIVNNKEIDINEFKINIIDNLKNHNGIYINDEQNNILKKYNINIDHYNNIDSLIYDIEEYLNESESSLEDLEWVSETLSEFKYYNKTNK